MVSTLNRAWTSVEAWMLCVKYGHSIDRWTSIGTQLLFEVWHLDRWPKVWWCWKWMLDYICWNQMNLSRSLIRFRVFMKGKKMRMIKSETAWHFYPNISLLFREIIIYIRYIISKIESFYSNWLSLIVGWVI